MDTNLIVPWETKASDAKTGIIEGFGAAFGNVDHGGDVIEPGAFARTIKEHKQNDTMPAMFSGHDRNEPIGEWLEMRETPEGLFMRGQLWIEGNKAGAIPIEKSNQAFNMLSTRGMKGLSIGFSPFDGGQRFEGDVRILSDLNLFETSPVSIPMNSNALVTSVKAAGALPDIRDLEASLREALGLTRKQAQALLSGGYKGLSDSALFVSESEHPKTKAALNNLLNSFSKG